MNGENMDFSSIANIAFLVLTFIAGVFGLWMWIKKKKRGY